MRSLPGAAASFVVGGVAVTAGVLGGCAAILDWSGYAGAGDVSVDAAEARPPGDVADAAEALDAAGAADVPGGQADARLEAAVVDGAFACGPATCGGCCTDAGCAGGQSVGTCGSGGAACADCTLLGEVCSAAGQCVVPVADAAPPPACIVSNCSVALCPALVYTTTCCKGDQTCGCQVVIPKPGPCM